jgi:hypothetical protein
MDLPPVLQLNILICQIFGGQDGQQLGQILICSRLMVQLILNRIFD